jgi:hypothetical protein
MVSLDFEARRMSDNPYQPPASFDAPLVGARERQWRQLWRIAIFQKAILLCLLVYGAAVVASLVIDLRATEILGLLVVADILIAVAFVFLLSVEVYGVFLGVTMALFTLIPVLGLFILALTNGKASAILRRHKLRVGLLGTSLQELRLAEAAEADP